MLRLLAGAALVGAGAADVPVLPKEYSVVIQMSMPYIPLEMPMRVLTSAKGQKTEFFDGLEVDMNMPDGTYKYVFNNSRRVCSFSPSSAGPTALQGSEWKATPFFPDLSQYKAAGEELVGGIMCQKFVLNTPHGTTGTMDDHISFYWDPVLSKPVRWHMHSRHVSFGSHTDEYVMNYLSFQAGAPSEADIALPAECHSPVKSDVRIQIHDFLSAAHALRVPSKSEASPLVFESFLQQHGKSYAPEEHGRRREIFEKNVLLLQEANRNHAGRANFRGNQFLDMTKEEVMSFRGGKMKGPSKSRRMEEHQKYVRSFEATGKSDMPKNFDWRTAKPGVVSPVKDQAMCGSCWTYGVTEPIESAQAIQTGKLVELPEQFVVDCTWTNGTGSSGQNSGCDGGDSDIGALEIIRKYNGIVPTAEAYGSYLSINGYCKDTRLMEVGAKITGWVDITARDEKAVMEALVTKGPLSIGIMVPVEMLYYDTGVLNVQSCKHNASTIDHAVVLTGFGTDEHGTNYWWVRNSWSTYWGDEGYIKIARGELDCCVTDQAGYADIAVGELIV